MLKSLIWFVALGLLAGGTAYYFFGPSSGPKEMPYAVTKKIIYRSAHGTGVVEGSSVPLRLRFPFAGVIDDINAREGDTVKQNDIVAKLNPSEVDSKIKLEDVALKEANAKRDALRARHDADKVAKAEYALKSEEAEVRDWQIKLAALKRPVDATLRQERLEAAVYGSERARLALAVAEAELKQVKARPTPDELAVAKARLEAAQLRTPGEASAAELRFALADYDKTKRGASAEDLNAAQARVDAATAEYKRAEFEKQKFEKPQPPAPLPESEIAAAQKALDEALKREAGKREELDKLRKHAEAADLMAADAAVEGSAERLKMLKTMRLGYELRAPFDALVTKRLAETGALLQPFEDVLWIVDFTRKRVRAEFDVMSLTDLVKNDGLKATIKSRAFGKEERAARGLGARVLTIGKAGPRRLMLEDPSQPKGGEVVEVLLEIERPEEPEKKEIYEKLLRPGLRGEASIVLESTKEAVVCVPVSYVESDPSGHYVWKTDVKNRKTNEFERPRRKQVVIGLRDEYYVEIKGDTLHEDDYVMKPPQGK